MSEVIERESTELVELPPKETALAIYSAVGGLDPLITEIRAKVADTVYDMATAKGRDECRSDAAKVAKSKTAIERLGKELSAQYKEIPKKIDAERKRAFDELEALQKQVRQPLTEWEEAESQRIAKLRDAVTSLRDLGACLEELDLESIKSRLAQATEIQLGEHWQEYETEASRAKDDAVAALIKARDTRQKHEADQAELARLKAEAEARRLQDEKDRIAREAAERATKEAEAKAQAERGAAAKREADAKAAQAKAEQDAKDAVERQKQAEARAEAEKLAAVKRAEEAAEAARLTEVKRQADEAARIEAEAKAREADREHKSKVLRKAKEAVMAAGITEDQARAVIRLISAGKVPRISVEY